MHAPACAHTDGCMLGSFRTRHVCDLKGRFFSWRPAHQPQHVFQFLKRNTNFVCLSHCTEMQHRALAFAPTLDMACFEFRGLSSLLCVCVCVFSLGKCQKEQRPLVLLLKTQAPFDATIKAPWEKTWTSKPPCSVLVPTLSPNHRITTWACSSSTWRQYKTVWRLKHIWLKMLCFSFPPFLVTEVHETKQFAKKQKLSKTGPEVTAWPLCQTTLLSQQKEQKKINSCSSWSF